MILIIDNYDSFTYNLVTYFRLLGEEVAVRLNDRTDIGRITALAPEAICISPGPKRPEDAPLSLEIFRRLSGRIPILGVCLGHQAFASSLGIPVVEGSRPMHGKISPITHDSKGLFRDLPSPLEVMRYHSLIVSDAPFVGDSFGTVHVTSRTADGVIMGLRDETRRVETVQFHPESVGTRHGLTMIENFLYEIRHHQK